MTSGKTVAKAVGGKTARACDSCIRKRARWYCAADDAFLCQSCDSLVHSANPLARRHERVRLKTASSKSSDVASVPAAAAAAELNLAPAWHRGFTKKARTPRHGKHHSWTTHQTPRGQDEPMRNPFHLVPEVGSDEYSNSHDENEEQLLYRVPIFDPFVAELCTPPSSVTSTEAAAVAGSNEVDNNESKRTESKVSLGNNNSNNSSNNNNNNNSVGNLHGGFLPSEMELAEFAADVESILGRGLENECIGMEDLGLIDSKEKEESRECSVGSEKVVKVEDEESPCKVEMGIREPFELSFDYESPATCEEAGEEKVGLDGGKHMKNINDAEIKGINNQRTRKTLSLQLDYEAVISTWASQKSPWTTGDKPDFDPDECWPDCMGTCGMEVHQAYYSGMGGYGCHTAMGDGGREARVSRYREKRRTRLFSKKIRYEVRKLNAEKRPRMKGRFVKRASFAVAAPPAFPLLNK